MFQYFWYSIENSLKNYGLEKKDFGKCLVCYTTVSSTLFFGLTGILYRYKPFHLIRSNPIFKAKFPFIERWDHKFHQLKPVQYLSENISYRPKEFSKALVESLIISKLFSPILTPLEIGGTVWIVKEWKKHFQEF